MSTDLSNTLVIGISATALFDLSEADQKFREEFMDAAIHGLPDDVRHDDSVRSMVEGGV